MGGMSPGVGLPAKCEQTARHVIRRSLEGDTSDVAHARFVEPMLLLQTDTLPEGERWRYELKLDGYRAIAFKSGGRLRLRSRNDKDFATRYPSILAGLAKLPDETVID